MHICLGTGRYAVVKVNRSGIALTVRYGLHCSYVQIRDYGTEYFLLLVINSNVWNTAIDSKSSNKL